MSSASSMVFRRYRSRWRNIFSFPFSSRKVYSFTSEKVGLVTFSSTPNCRQIAWVRVVLPAPRSPERVKILLVPKVARMPLAMLSSSAFSFTMISFTTVLLLFFLPPILPKQSRLMLRRKWPKSRCPFCSGTWPGRKTHPSRRPATGR